jgi:hypothetical protein
MLIAEVTFYNVVLFLHIAAVVLIWGPTYSYSVFLATAMKRGGHAVPAVGQAITTWDRPAATLGVVVVLATGLYMAGDIWEFSDFFISWGFLAIIVLTGLAHGFFIPKTRKATELAERDIAASPPDGDVQFSEEFNEISDQLAKVGTVAGILVLVTLYIMTAKPFL